MSTNTNNVLSLVATTASRVRELPIKDCQLVMIRDIGRIAFDFKGQRTFYNQIVELEKDEDRLALESPSNGYYFVIDKATFWAYKDGWIQITSEPQEIVFIGVELPELGQANRIYIKKNDKEISIWDSETNRYIVVSNYTEDATETDIENLFN